MDNTMVEKVGIEEMFDEQSFEAESEARRELNAAAFPDIADISGMMSEDELPF